MCVCVVLGVGGWVGGGVPYKGRVRDRGGGGEEALRWRGLSVKALAWSLHLSHPPPVPSLSLPLCARHTISLRPSLTLLQVDDQSKSAAKMMVHLLKQPQQQQPAATSTAAAAAAPAKPSLDRSLSLGLGTPGTGCGVEVQGMVHSRTTAEPSTTQGSAALPQGLSLQQGSGVLPEGAAAAGVGVDFEAAGEGVPMSAAVSSAADGLDALVQLLEQYCHPSNTGSWSSELAVFLRHGVHYFMKVGGG